MQVKAWSVKLIIGVLGVVSFGVWIGWKLTQYYTQQNFRLRPPNYEFVIPTSFQQRLKEPESQLITPQEFEEMIKKAKKVYGADLKGKGGQKGRARLVIKEGKSYLGVWVKGLKSVGKGFFYQVWLFDDKQRLLPVERLIYEDKSKSGMVYVKTAKDLNGFSGVIVSLESESQLQTPSKVVAEGEIKW